MRTDPDVERARAWLSGRAGLIARAPSMLRSPDEPKLFSSTVLMAPETQAFMGFQFGGNFGAMGFTFAQAFMGAVGECIERYCCAVMDRSQLIRATQDELGSDAVGMDRFAVYADWQYEQPGWWLPRWAPSTPMSWVEGRSLIDGGRRFVPACLVYVPFLPAERSDFHAVSVSSGQACHSSWERALLTGLFEVVERDAFMINWLRSIPGREVDYRSDPIMATMMDRYFGSSRLKFRVFDFTLDISIPTMVCTVEADSCRGTLVGMGAATRASAREAAEKALLEAAQDMVWCRDLIKRKPDWRPKSDWSNVIEFEDHVRLYCEPDMRQHLGFLLDVGRPPRTLDPTPAAATVSEQLADCLARVSAAGLDCIVVDTTTPDIREAGYVAPKVMIPGTAHLTACHAQQALGSPRIWSAPARCGLDADCGSKLNPIPHPFP